MTGLETGMVIAGKFLAPHAAKVSGALARKWTYRWRIERSVTARVDFRYSKQHFRAWLKTVKSNELAEPAEIGGPPMAVRLDQWLSARDETWSTSADRTSKALRLVEVMYLAILTNADPGLGQQLSEQWSRQRNGELVSRVVELAGGYGPVNPEDLAIWLRRRSAERRRIRLEAFEVDEADVDDALHEMQSTVPDVPVGSVLALIGTFGAGKSEVAEEWHRAAIERFSRGNGSPVPVWVRARDIGHSGLELTIAQLVGATAIRARGVAAVVDGLDEVDGATAESIAHDARVLTADQRSSVLLTCRPGVLPPRSNDVVTDGVSETSARALVERLTGRDHATRSWTSGLIETVRRPFFALGAALLIRNGDAITGQAELVAKLVEKALSQGASTKAITRIELYKVLTELGASLTRTNGSDDGLSFQQRQAALTTRLVTRGVREMVAFTLPIFEQWFAAQALRERPDLWDNAVATPRAFDRWRWAIATAVVEGPPSRIDDLVEACLRLNPGAGAWIVDQASGSRSQWAQTAAVPLDVAQTQQRLLRATRAWIDAISPLAPKVFPLSSTIDPIKIGVRVNGRGIQMGWSLAPGADDEVVDLPGDVQPFSQTNSDWQLTFGGVVPEAEIWPWARIRDDIAGRTLGMLNNDDLLGPTDGIWQLESRYRAARIVSGIRTILHEPLDRVILIHAVENVLATTTDPVHTVFNIGGAVVSGRELSELLAWLRGQAFAQFERPVPAPDLRSPSGNWIWCHYSPQQLSRFCAETFGLACIAYEEMVDTVFAKFDWSLGMNACRPVGVLGALHIPEPGATDDVPLLEYMELPMELMREELAQSGSKFVLSANQRAAVLLESANPGGADRHERWQARITMLRDWIAQSDIEGPFWTLSSGSTVIDCAHERPVSRQAAQWIWRDLKRLSLGSGSFPRLGR